MQGEEKWALLYLMTWPAEECNSPPKVIDGIAIFPEVHGFYNTEKEAFQVKSAKINPTAYFVRRMRNYSGSGI